MKEKADGMPLHERRGVLLLDEVKLSPAVRFDKHRYEFIGFTDLGRYTPDDQIDKHGDHALVLTYQPFQGNWIQSIAAFLSKGAVSGHLLTQIIMEAVILIENSNFFVDAITTDGAQWNRGVWTQLRVSPQQPYSTHFADESRKLFFFKKESTEFCFSDFPHLMKCLWTWIINKKEIKTPDGIVRLQYWTAIVDFDEQRQVKLESTLSRTHVSPKKYERMSVKRAYQFFSRNAAAAMKYLRGKNFPQMEGCEATIKYIERIAALIHAFDSRCGKNGLRNPSPERRVIVEFLKYLSESDIGGAASSSTLVGLRVTCSAALQLSDFLILEFHYLFVMLTRFNQDNLERFFGMVRAACGTHDHPDPMIFLLIFRLMSVYSLVKPTKGSNVTGEQLFDTLIKDGEVSYKNAERWRFMRSRLVGQSVQNFIPADISAREKDEILEFLCGYVAKKAVRFRPNYEACSSTLLRQRDLSDESPPSLLDLKDYYGVLSWPSDELYQLLKNIETVIISEVGEESKLHPETFFRITYMLEEQASLTSVGCEIHAEVVTAYVIQFFLVLRMHFLCKIINAEIKNPKKAVEMRKVGKIIPGS